MSRRLNQLHLRPTPKQVEVLKTIWETEGQKGTAHKLGVDRHTVESHMMRLRERLGIKSVGRYGTIALLKWGVRAGILTMFLVTTLYARPHRRPPPPPIPPPQPPPMVTYVTNYTRVTLGWNAVPTPVSVYNLQYWNNFGETGNVLTFSLSTTVTQLRTNAIYSFEVRDADTNNVWSAFSNVVMFGTTSNVVVTSTTTSQ